MTLFLFYSRHSARGSSLVELMLGLSLLFTVMTAALSSAHTALSLNDHITRIARGTIIAEQVTEQLLVMDGSDARLEAGTHEARFDPEGNEVEDGPFTARWTISSYERTPGIRRIHVEITWLEQDRERSLSWETYRN